MSLGKKDGKTHSKQMELGNKQVNTEESSFKFKLVRKDKEDDFIVIKRYTHQKDSTTLMQTHMHTIL